MPNNVIDKREKIYPITSYLDIEKDFYRRTLVKARRVKQAARRKEILVKEFTDKIGRRKSVRMHTVNRDNFVKEFIERAEKLYTQQYKI